MNPQTPSGALVPPRFFEPEKKGIRCVLCHHKCFIRENSQGICGVRECRGEEPYLNAFGLITAAAVDPVEKKPLYHFHPGEKVFSVGFASCNLKCPFCQNYRIAGSTRPGGDFIAPADLVDTVLSSGEKMIAYTYSEPTIHIEYLLEVARIAAEKGLENLLVSNGSLEAEPAEELLLLMDGVNIDLKSWNADYYQKVLKGNLETTKKFIQIASRLSWLEVTTLVVPGDNDDEKELEGLFCWLAELSPDIPLHLNAYHPANQYKREATSSSLLRNLGDNAGRYLNFVYLGNTGAVNNTFCPECSSLVIQRDYMNVESFLSAGHCRECGAGIPGVFRKQSSL